MLKVNAFDANEAAALSAEERRLVERRQRLLGPAYQLFYDRPLHLVRGQGCYLYDQDGRGFLDLYNNVASIGHSHPKVVEAMATQAAQLCTHTRYLHESVLDYAETLLATMPEAVNRLMLTCTGSEANDLALRIARDYTGGSGVIVTEYAYHGMTTAIAALSPSEGEYVPLSRDCRLVPAPYYIEEDPTQVGAVFAQSVRQALAQMRRHGIRPAALLLDTLFTSDGVFADPPGFLLEAVQAVRDAGGLLIADEVQPGFARTGRHFWGFARHGLVPDLVTMGKPMGNGYPMAGVAMRAEVLQRFGEQSGFFNTFAGNPVAAKVGLAVLQVIAEEGLQENARKIGQLLKDGLQSIAKDVGVLAQVRGAGLFLGVDVLEEGAPSAALARQIVNALRDQGMLIGVAGLHSHVLKIRPQLCFTEHHAGQFLDTMRQIVRRH